MHHRIKRVSSLILSGGVALSLLAGCAGNGSTGSGSSASGGTAAPGKRVTLKVELFDRGNLQPGQEPLINNQYTKYIQKEFGDKNNIDVQFVPVPRSREVDQLNVLMASGDAPDIVFTYDINLVYNYVQKGGLTDLGDVLNKNGPSLKKFIGDDVLTWGQFDGKQYAIPAKRIGTAGQIGSIRKDWLDKLGMPVPTTTQQFYNTMKAFKDKDPGNVGKDKIVPFKLDQYSYQLLLWSFAPPLSEEDLYTYEAALNGPNDRPNPMRPGFKDGMKFLNKMYNEGLVNLDYILDKDGKKAKEQFVNGQTGAMFGSPGNRLDIMKDLKASVPNASYVVMDAFSDSTGKHPKPALAKNGMYMMVPKGQHAAEAIKYMDWMTSPDAIKYMQNGTEGKDYTMKDGIPTAIVNDETKKDFYSSDNQDFCIIVNGKWLGDEQTSIKALAAKYPGYEQLFLDELKAAGTDTLPTVHFQKPIQSEAKYGATLNQKWQDAFVKMVSAKETDFDKVFDATAAEYMKAGAQEIMNEKKAEYQAEKQKK